MRTSASRSLGFRPPRLRRFALRGTGILLQTDVLSASLRLYSVFHSGSRAPAFAWARSPCRCFPVGLSNEHAEEHHVSLTHWHQLCVHCEAFGRRSDTHAHARTHTHKHTHTQLQAVKQAPAAAQWRHGCFCDSLTDFMGVMGGAYRIRPNTQKVEKRKGKPLHGFGLRSSVHH